MGVEVTEESEGIRVRSQLENFKAVHVKTLLHPGFPTDIARIYSLMRQSQKGESTMVGLKTASNTWKKCAVWACIQRLSVIQPVLLGDRLARGRSSINGPSALVALIFDRFGGARRNSCR